MLEGLLNQIEIINLYFTLEPIIMLLCAFQNKDSKVCSITILEKFPITQKQ